MARMVFPYDSQVYNLLIIYSARGNQLNIDLFTNDFTPTPLSVLADFVLPTYAGYIQVGNGALNWGIGPDGTVYGACISFGGFQMTDNLTPTSVFGYVLTDIFTGALVGSGRFDDAPLNLITIQNFIVPTMRYSFVPRGIVTNSI